MFNQSKPKPPGQPNNKDVKNQRLTNIITAACLFDNVLFPIPAKLPEMATAKTAATQIKLNQKK